MQGVPKTNLEKYLNSSEMVSLNEVDTIHAWGCQPSLENKWNSMEYGDYVMFYARGRFISVGELIFKKKSNELALALWPRSKETHEPWNCVFFVNNLIEIDLSLEDFNEITGYKLTAVMGFMPIRNGINNLEKRFGSVDRFVEQLKTGLQLSKIDELATISNIPLSINSKESIAKFDELTRDKSDEVIETALANYARASSGITPEKITKLISSYKRNRRLVADIKSKYKNKCQICGFTFRMSNGNYYSEAAHIIPISSGKEGVDSPDNIWVLCANHHKMLDTCAIKSVSKTEYIQDGITKTLVLL
jgi:hypothetical protein